jgi:hypothetical protein
MYFWYLLDHASTPSRHQRRQRMVLSFGVMLVFGVLAFALRLAKETTAGT